MIVADATPLIHLSKIGKITLLKNVFSRVIIPAAVFREVVVKGREKAKIDAEIIATQPWITQQQLTEKQQEEVKALVKVANIGLGEAEAIILAKHEKKALLIDDAVGVQVAQSFNIDTYWTTSVLFRAVHEEKITKEEARTIVENLVQTGYRLKP